MLRKSYNPRKMLTHITHVTQVKNQPMQPTNPLTHVTHKFGFGSQSRFGFQIHSIFDRIEKQIRLLETMLRGKYFANALRCLVGRIGSESKVSLQEKGEEKFFKLVSDKDAH